MNAGVWLLTATASAGAGSLLALSVPRRARAIAAAVGTAGAAIAGLAAAATVLFTGSSYSARLPGVLPFTGTTIALDALGGVFVVVAALVAIPAVVYGVGYSKHGPTHRTFQATLPLFVLSMLLVPAAGSVSTFLVLWELMALTSLAVVLAEHRERAEVRGAGLWYATMTQLGFVAILGALVMLATLAGGETFATIAAHAARIGAAARSLVFVLALIGFGSKAGLVPLHVWLPRAHPEAPSHGSALLSGAMVKLGVYGLVRVAFDLLGGGPRWWWLVLLAVGASSALFGILHALVTPDLKRLLAYSTTENVGLITIALGAAGLFATSGAPALAAIALAAALLHTINHGAFKSLLFLGAGSVLTGTRTRNLDELGGLVRTMPATSAFFAVGALAIAALPPLNGFVGEWVLLQSLIHGAHAGGLATAAAMPVAVGTVALTAGLAAATFVKAFGTGFLARPRSAGAAAAVESPLSMRLAMGLLAVTCVLLGVAPGLLARPLALAVAVVVPNGSPLQTSGVFLALDGVRASVSPAVVAGGLVAVCIVVLAGLRAFGAARARRTAESWGCGRSHQTARMEYTATSFAEPLQRVFDDVLRPDLDLDVSHRVESRWYVESIRFRSQIRDAIERKAYAPVISLTRRWGERARAIQNGSIHRYLGYAFAAFVLALVASR